MAAKVQGNQLILTGLVGRASYYDDTGFTSSEVINALAVIGGEEAITVRVNSAGGLATEGAAIYAALKAHKGPVLVIVEGVAASAASLLAMAGDEIEMAPGAIMMIHDPATITFGDAAAHQKAIEALNAMGDAYAAIYAERSGKTKAKAREIMKAESWFDGEAAVAAGFATRATSASNDNKPAEPSAFDYRVYAKAPAALVALAEARGWNERAFTAAAAAPPRQPENPMKTHTQQGGATASQTTEATQADPAAGATTETTATPPADPVAEATARASAIVEACVAAGVAGLAAGLITSGKTLHEVKARIADAGAIRAAVDQARKVSPNIEASLADKFISEGKSAEQARAALLDEIVAKQSPEVTPATPTATKTGAAAWDKHVERINARNAA